MNKDLMLDSYDYELDESFIATRPTKNRDDAKLLVYEVKTGRIIHSTFKSIATFLPKESLIVFNQSKVFPSRLLGKKITGGKVEVFVLSVVSDAEGIIPALIKTSRKKNIGDQFLFNEEVSARIEKVFDDGTFGIKFSIKDLQSYLARNGMVPIPPYIRDGESDQSDSDDYQTLYAKHVGSVAAPTAGLHFTDDIFESLEVRGVDKGFVTLHVGLGTFLPVKNDVITDHSMHNEKYLVEKNDLKKINSSKFITAVGTTSLRVLESSHGKKINADELYSTEIFLYPGVDVKSIQALVTNFHLPKSTLLMLVSSLIGREKTLELYEVAKENNYRFFSYGDGMLILR